MGTSETTAAVRTANTVEYLVAATKDAGIHQIVVRGNLTQRANHSAFSGTVSAW